ncbi:hypothetical protein [Mucilaginibacter pedocola]|uniref:Uncharacterized protein n=1 Tax=Mucilaginibacter pedocola TaxID=1792845 RepID=A0A1S9PD98_9SPHI|nr:hypothetical protein [Mucilaginibacter pedocola]OOQ58538.1 hypothetical protein BC343_07675 [Mucilaginibacter pedocola]
MEYKNIIYGLLVLALVLAIIFKDKVKASFMGMKLNAENGSRRNKLDIDGKNNKVKQGSGSSKTPANNTAKVRGEDHDVEQN